MATETIPGMRVNPLSLVKGTRIATKFHVDEITGEIRIERTREIKRIGYGLGTVREGGSCSPECVHLDHECYDTRFSSVVVPAKGK